MSWLFQELGGGGFECLQGELNEGRQPFDILSNLKLEVTHTKRERKIREREGEEEKGRGREREGENRASAKQTPQPGLHEKNQVEIGVLISMNFNLINQATKCQIIWYVGFRE